MLKKAGTNTILLCDSKGISSRARTNLNPEKQQFAVETKGTLADALKDGDIFSGVRAKRGTYSQYAIFYIIIILNPLSGFRDEATPKYVLVMNLGIGDMLALAIAEKPLLKGEIFSKMTNFQVETREWWVQRWLELLDSYRFKKRLERGRNYAREGNVLSIDFTEAQAFAKVQGSDVEPYQVSLALEPFTDEDWDFVIETMSQKAIYSAQLLAGEMPDNIEEVFTANGLSLFPFTLSDVHSRCTCPDKANPCKHIAAVYYQLGTRFSEDPFVIFQLRGRTREQILERLREIRI